MTSDSEAAARRARRAARRSWPGGLSRLEDAPEALAPRGSSPEERLAMVEELSRQAWSASGRPVPDYERRSAPGRVLRPGEG